jgi:hypothetical protein
MGRTLPIAAPFSDVSAKRLASERQDCMESPWIQIFIAALTSSTFTAVVLAALAYVGRSIIERWLARNLEEYKAELQAVAFEQQTKFAKLHERRAEAIAELYRQFVQIQDSLHSMARALRSGANPKAREKCWKSVNESIEAFSKYFEEHRIYLPESLCRTIERFKGLSRSTSLQLQFAEFSKQLASEDEGYREEFIQDLEEATSSLADTISPLIRDIEKEFRKMLGDTES